MKLNDTVFVNEWNQASQTKRTAPEETNKFPTEMENSYGKLCVPESVQFAHGRLMDRASRVLMLGQTLER